MNSQTTTSLWNHFCELRLQSPAYRAIDDPIVRRAYEKWREADEQESAVLRTGNVIPFAAWKTRRGAA